MAFRHLPKTCTPTRREASGEQQIEPYLYYCIPYYWCSKRFTLPIILPSIELIFRSRLRPLLKPRCSALQEVRLSMTRKSGTARAETRWSSSRVKCSDLIWLRGIKSPGKKLSVCTRVEKERARNKSTRTPQGKHTEICQSRPPCSWSGYYDVGRRKLAQTVPSCSQDLGPRRLAANRKEWPRLKTPSVTHSEVFMVRTTEPTITRAL